MNFSRVLVRATNLWIKRTGLQNFRIFSITALLVVQLPAGVANAQTVDTNAIKNVIRKTFPISQDQTSSATTAFSELALSPQKAVRSIEYDNLPHNDVEFGGETLYSISVRISFSDGTSLEGVTVSYDTDHSVITDTDGNYLFSGIAAGEYLLTPSLEGYTFDPTSTTLSVVDVDVVDVNFTAIQDTKFGISGKVSLASGTGLSDVLITHGPGLTTTTDENGKFKLADLDPGIYTLIPTKTDYLFNPVNQVVTVGPSMSDVTFTGHTFPSNYAKTSPVPDSVDQPVAATLIWESSIGADRY